MWICVENVVVNVECFFSCSKEYHSHSKMCLSLDKLCFISVHGKSMCSGSIRVGSEVSAGIPRKGGGV